MNCPKCGLEMMDVRASKSSPKAPDFTCTDPNCVNEKGYRTGAWLPKPKPAPQATQVVRGPKWTWKVLQETYRRSLLIAEQQIINVAKRSKIAYTTADVLAGAATIFICATRDGVMDERPKPEPVTAAALAGRPEQLDDDSSSDLPF